jgi:NAD(P)-dependent dehydrogenase (short-subunit alcohol dehydrogenase family)
MPTHLVHGLPTPLAKTISDRLHGLSSVEIRPDDKSAPDVAVIGIGLHANAPVPTVLTDPKEWLDAVIGSLTSGFAAIRETALRMRTAGGGKLIIICEDAGIRGVGGYSATSAISGAAIATTKTLGRELAPSGVLVNAIALPITSGFTQKIKGLVDEQDVASSVAYLADPDLTSLVGQVIALSYGTSRSRI